MQHGTFVLQHVGRHCTGSCWTYGISQDKLVRHLPIISLKQAQSSYPNVLRKQLTSAVIYQFRWWHAYPARRWYGPERCSSRLTCIQCDCLVASTNLFASQVHDCCKNKWALHNRESINKIWPFDVIDVVNIANSKASSEVIIWASPFVEACRWL